MSIANSRTTNPMGHGLGGLMRDDTEIVPSWAATTTTAGETLNSGSDVELADTSSARAYSDARSGIDSSRFSGDSGTTTTTRKSMEADINQASILSSFCNLANTILGSGMLGLPYAFAQSGYILGTLLILVCGMSSAFALHTLSLCALKTPGNSSFYSVCHHVMPSLTALIDIAVSIKCFGVATSYFIVIGDLMPEVMIQFGASHAARNRQLWVLVGFVIVAPLSCMKNLDSLKFTSFLSIGFVAFLTMLICLYMGDVPSLDACADVDDGDVCKGETSYFITSMETLRVLSIFIFGFTCQQNIFSVTNELSRPIIARVNIVIAMSIGAAFFIYIIVACTGYYTFGSKVESDILISYPESATFSVARLFVSLLVAFSYPLQAHPARKCVLTLLGKLLDGDSNEELTLRTQQIRYWSVSVVFLFGSLLIGLTLTNLGVMLALVGATGSTMVSYVLPGFLYYLTFNDTGPAWKRNLAFFQGCMGLIIIPFCLTFIFV